MVIVPPPDDVHSLLAQFREIRGVVEYSFAVSEDNKPLDAEAQRQAILLAFQDWNENFKEHCKAGLRYVQTNKDYRANYPQDTVQKHVEQYASDIEQGLRSKPNTLQGERISPLQFLGRNFTIFSGRRVIREENVSMREELERLKISPNQGLPDDYDEYALGYAYAFSNTPHGLRGDPEASLRLFRSLNQALFNDFAEDLEIYAWSTDWCGYFDAGAEWWGSFLWTVYNPLRKLVIVVAASTTD